ncbi:hypothetical protein HDF16_005176 [Granulicella aggregans]|uniref:Uncharacterized protein n=1 Tax=Granulicella aggregans TaxID=474949 RepID=A0A7W8E7N2_9BACT|nr:hypothetical protein [Granulicella aggregans]
MYGSATHCPSFTLDIFFIAQTMSRHEDTDFVSFTEGPSIFITASELVFDRFGFQSVRG